METLKLLKLQVGLENITPTDEGLLVPILKPAKQELVAAIDVKDYVKIRNIFNTWKISDVLTPTATSKGLLEKMSLSNSEDEFADEFGMAVDLFSKDPASDFTMFLEYDLLETTLLQLDSKENATIIGAMLKTGTTKQLKLIQAFLKNHHNDPAYGKLWQKVEISEFKDPAYQRMLQNTVYGDVRKERPEYIQKIIKSLFDSKVTPQFLNSDEKAIEGPSEPLGGGTVAETHLVALDKNKTKKVAIKVLRENIAERLNIGIERLTKVAKAQKEKALSEIDSITISNPDLFEEADENSLEEVLKMNKAAQKWVIDFTYTHFVQDLNAKRKELDLNLERENLRTAEKIYTGERTKSARLVSINGMKESNSAVVMEYAEGMSMSDVEKAFSTGELNKEDVEPLFEAFAELHLKLLQSLASGKMVHADLHHGNLRYNPKTKILHSFDYGAAETMSKQDFKKMILLFAGAISMKESMIAEALDDGKQTPERKKEILQAIRIGLASKSEGIQKTFAILSSLFANVKDLELPEGVMLMSNSLRKIDQSKLFIEQATKMHKVSFDEQYKDFPNIVGKTFIRQRFGTFLHVLVKVGPRGFARIADSMSKSMKDKPGIKPRIFGGMARFFAIILSPGGLPEPTPPEKKSSGD